MPITPNCTTNGPADTRDPEAGGQTTRTSSKEAVQLRNTALPLKHGTKNAAKVAATLDSLEASAPRDKTELYNCITPQREDITKSPNA